MVIGGRKTFQFHHAQESSRNKLRKQFNTCYKSRNFNTKCLKHYHPIVLMKGTELRVQKTNPTLRLNCSSLIKRFLKSYWFYLTEVMNLFEVVEFEASADHFRAAVR